MATTFLLGGTGLVGSNILSTLRASPLVSTIDIIARRSPPKGEADDKITSTSLIEPDTSKWPSHIKTLQPVPQIYFTAFGTTKAAAGGFQNQYKLDHDLNVELAKEAKDAGTKVFVLISSSGASPTSRIAYSRMKGEIEEHVKELGFEHTVIVRPGMIAGNRTESRPLEAVFRKVADVAGKIHGSLKNGWAQDADVIAKAAVSAGFKALNGEAPEKVWILGQSDIIRLGLTEWKD